MKRPGVLPELGVPCAFQPEYLDFKRGIHVGNLEENERITRILKLALEARYGQPFVTERFGRGVYWRWIGFLPRANRLAKPVSSHVSFGCSKFFLMVDTDAGAAKFGLQVERGYEQPSADAVQFQLGPDWDWHRLLAVLKPRNPVAGAIERLVLEEGFQIHAGGWHHRPATISKQNYPGLTKLRKLLEAGPKNDWVGFQLYFAMSEDEVKGSTGLDLVESMLAVYRELLPAMNACMQIELAEGERPPTD